MAVIRLYTAIIEKSYMSSPVGMHNVYGHIQYPIPSAVVSMHGSDSLTCQANTFCSHFSSFNATVLQRLGLERATF